MGASILVTGGAGYIGSHTARQLVEAGHRVLVADNLYSGYRWAVPAAAEFVRVDVAQRARLAALMRERGVEAVVHFAGYTVVPESVAEPLKYYRNNVAGTCALLEACVETRVDKFVFSSSAAVYGIPQHQPVREDAPTEPISPYGATKLIVEWMLRDLAASRAFRYVSLRYFNVAGASLDGTLGQATAHATHLIKVAAEAACGKRDGVVIFGTDYPTADGTGVRDYVHVDDLARAHLAALEYLFDGGRSEVLNCGYGTGFSVREVLHTVRAVSGVDFAVREGPRRPGDPPQLIADARRIRRVLDWAPQYQDLEVICRSAYEWERDGMRRYARAGGAS